MQHRRKHISCNVEGYSFIEIGEEKMDLRVKEFCALPENNSIVATTSSYEVSHLEVI